MHFVRHMARLRLVALITCFVAVSYFLCRPEPAPMLLTGIVPPDVEDKIWHFSAFLALSVGGLAMFSSRKKTVVLVLFLFGVGAEFLQGTELLPRRAFSLTDIAADVGGLLGGYFIFIWRCRGKAVKNC